MWRWGNAGMEVGRARSSRMGLARLRQERSVWVHALEREWVIGNQKWEPGDPVAGCLCSPNGRGGWCGVGLEVRL